MRMTQKTLLTTRATYRLRHVARMTFVQLQLSCGRRHSVVLLIQL